MAIFSGLISLIPIICIIYVFDTVWVAMKFGNECKEFLMDNDSGTAVNWKNLLGELAISILRIIIQAISTAIRHIRRL